MNQGEDSLPLLGIPDWAIAKAYRRAVAKFDPEITRGVVLMFACDVTLDASTIYNEFGNKRTDYATDPLKLAEWMRRHWRNNEGTFETEIPELHWIYAFLLRAGNASANPHNQTP